MKKLWLMIVAAIVFSGCSTRQTMETISDSMDIPVAASLQQLEITLPSEASIPTLLSEDGARLYECEDYTLCVQTLESGDLDRTLRRITGFAKDGLTVMTTQSDGLKRHSCVWSAAGEGGDHVGRAVVLDDGNYHYAVSVMAEFSKAGNLSEKWKELFDSVNLTSTD